MTEGKDWVIRKMQIGGNKMWHNQRNHTQEVKLQIKQVKQEVTKHET